MTRAEKRKRDIVWSKVAPIHAPHYALLEISRYVPGGRSDGRWDVWDRRLGRFLDRADLIKVRDENLRSESLYPDGCGRA